MADTGLYEVVVGLEVHAQLLTQSKLFCGDSTAFGVAPNTSVSPITLGHPGTLPKMNRQAVELAVKMGLACHCTIEQHNYFARKNYFYPDLPKGYQVSQHTTPVCKGGYISIHTSDGERNIRLNRIHMEEDAGKSIHDADEHSTCVDYNRAGTPLIEIVTEPDLRSAEEAYACLTEIRKLVRYLDVCDGNMEEGSLRCDANISVRLKGEQQLGTKVEVKNLNSIRNVKRAIEAEAARLIQVLQIGGTVIQETRSYDADTNTTFSIREKEDADDYRYFPEPDLAPFHLQDAFIERIRKSIPPLPAERVKKYITGYQLPDYDAQLLAEERSFADYYETLAAAAKPKPAANWMLGPVKNWLNENNSTIALFPLSAAALAALINMVSNGQLSFTAASGKLFTALLAQPGADPQQLAATMNLLQESDHSAIGTVVDEVLEKLAAKVAEYKKGKKGLLALFTGEVMKRSGGKADPKVVNTVLLEKLKK